MATQQCVQHALGALGLGGFGHLRDMTNAFASTGDHVRHNTVENRLPACTYSADGPCTSIGKRELFKQRLDASVIEVTDCDRKPAWVVPETGNIVGSSEGPLLFSDSYHRYIEGWLLERVNMADGPVITLVHPRGSLHAGEIACFADDTLAIRVVVPGEALHKALHDLRNDDLCFDEWMNSGGWRQNQMKADIVPFHLGGTRKLVAAALSDPDLAHYAERIKPTARHLGGTVSFNQSYRYELSKRLLAMRAGWASLGSYWSSRGRKQAKRCMLLTCVVEPALSGLTAIAPSGSQMGRLTSVLCLYLRKLEAGKACKKTDKHGKELLPAAQPEIEVTRGRTACPRQPLQFVRSTAITHEYEAMVQVRAAALPTPAGDSDTDDDWQCRHCLQYPCTCGRPLRNDDDPSFCICCGESLLECKCGQGMLTDEEEDEPPCCIRCGETAIECKCGKVFGGGGGAQAVTVVSSDSDVLEILSSSDDSIGAFDVLPEYEGNEPTQLELEEFTRTEAGICWTKGVLRNLLLQANIDDKIKRDHQQDELPPRPLPVPTTSCPLPCQLCGLALCCHEFNHTIIGWYDHRCHNCRHLPAPPTPTTTPPFVRRPGLPGCSLPSQGQSSRVSTFSTSSRHSLTQAPPHEHDAPTTGSTADTIQLSASLPLPRSPGLPGCSLPTQGQSSSTTSTTTFAAQPPGSAHDHEAQAGSPATCHITHSSREASAQAWSPSGKENSYYVRPVTISTSLPEASSQAWSRGG